MSEIPTTGTPAPETYTLEGWLSIRAALISGSREVHELLLERGRASSSLAKLEKRAREQGIPARRVERDELLRHTDGHTHGGAVALVGPRRFLPLDDLGRGPSAPFLAMLDGVEDPFNFGQTVRALHAAGAHGLVLRPRNWTTASSVVGRASAGSSEFMPMALVDSDDALITHLEGRSVRLVCTDMGPGSMSLYDADFRAPLLLVIGGERRGASKTLLERADLKVRIPYGRRFKQALGTTAAAAVTAFEVMRQRQR